MSENPGPNAHVIWSAVSGDIITIITTDSADLVRRQSVSTDIAISSVDASFVDASFVAAASTSVSSPVTQTNSTPRPALSTTHFTSTLQSSTSTAPSTSSTLSNPSPSSSGLSTAAKAGIGASVGLVALLMCVVVITCLYRYKVDISRRHTEKDVAKSEAKELTEAHDQVPELDDSRAPLPEVEARVISEAPGHDINKLTITHAVELAGGD